MTMQRQLLIVSILWAGLLPASGQTTNTWISSGNDFWDHFVAWSAGVAPTSSFALVSVTNANTKTVTIDYFTAGSFPGTLTISNLLLSAPAGSTNTLSIAPAGSNTPLRVLNRFT